MKIEWMNREKERNKSDTATQQQQRNPNKTNWSAQKEVRTVFFSISSWRQKRKLAVGCIAAEKVQNNIKDSDDNVDGAQTTSLTTETSVKTEKHSFFCQKQKKTRTKWRFHFILRYFRIWFVQYCLFLPLFLDSLDIRSHVVRSCWLSVYGWYSIFYFVCTVFMA